MNAVRCYYFEKYISDEEFINLVRRVVLNEIDGISDGNHKVAESIRSKIRNNYTSNANSTRQSKSRRSIKKDNRTGGQQRGIDSTKNVKDNGRGITKNSEKSSNFFTKKRCEKSIAVVDSINAPNLMSKADSNMIFLHLVIILYNIKIIVSIAT